MKQEMTISEFASKGGKARALSLSKEQRIAIAKKANKAMNEKRKLSTSACLQEKKK